MGRNNIVGQWGRDLEVRIKYKGRRGDSKVRDG